MPRTLLSFRLVMAAKLATSSSEMGLVSAIVMSVSDDLID